MPAMGRGGPKGCQMTWLQHFLGQWYSAFYVSVIQNVISLQLYTYIIQVMHSFILDATTLYDFLPAQQSTSVDLCHVNTFSCLQS
jgi:hypothetical protein